MALFGNKDRAGAAVETDEAVPREPFLRGIVNQWWERLYAMAFGRVPLGDQARLYSANRATHDYVWNTIGQTLWGSLLPILTIVATQLSGAEEAGRFNLAFTIATLLLFLGNYGVRTFQVSDLDEMDSFGAYQVQRVITCLVMLALGWAYCSLRNYDATMATIAAASTPVVVLLFMLLTVVPVDEGKKSNCGLSNAHS